VKNQKFSRKQLRYIYTYCDSVEDSKVEKWNMHTLSNKVIEKEKIKLLKINDSIKATDIIEYMRKKSNIKIKKELPFLDYYFELLDEQKK